MVPSATCGPSEFSSSPCLPTGHPLVQGDFFVWLFLTSWLFDNCLPIGHPLLEGEYFLTIWLLLTNRLLVVGMSFPKKRQNVKYYRPYLTYLDYCNFGHWSCRPLFNLEGKQSQTCLPEMMAQCALNWFFGQQMIWSRNGMTKTTIDQHSTCGILCVSDTHNIPYIECWSMCLWSMCLHENLTYIAKLSLYHPLAE